MPANTTKGLPYPLVTDALAGGAGAIQALAQALDFTRIPLLTAAQVPSAGSLLSLYPLGLSLLSLSTAEAGAGAWPAGASCHIATIKPTTSRAAQFLFRNASAPVTFYYRQLLGDPGPHSGWIQITGAPALSLTPAEGDAADGAEDEI